MSDHFVPTPFPELDPMFRMPADFGPAPGPRNLPNSFKDLRAAGRLLINKVQARSEAAALQTILPPGLSLDGDPLINLQYVKFSNLGWLAGRGYNIIAITIPVTYELAGSVQKFEYMPVLWEGLADPVITGREELGHPKLPATIPDPVFLRDTARGAAHWEGFRFCEFEIDALRPDDRPPSAPVPYITRKYLPRTGEWGIADVDQLTGPIPDDDSGNGGRPTIYRRDRGQGSFRFIPARWEDMPTQYPVVCRLAELPLLEFTDAVVVEFEGGPGNGRSQGIYGDLAKLP